jgi:HEAT repeat protein
VRRPLRVSAAALGLSEAELIARLASARSVAEVALYVDKLGLVGTDRAIGPLLTVASDLRGSLPEQALTAIGKIGSADAVAALIELTEDERPRQRGAAVSALAVAGGDDARAVLTAIAQDRGDRSARTRSTPWARWATTPRSRP